MFCSFSAKLIFSEVESQSSIRCHNTGSFQCVLQFADISRPVVALQLLHVGQCQSRNRASQLSSEASQKVLCQQRNVFNSFSQWGQFHRKHAQSIVQILPEATRFGFVSQVSIGRRDDANVDPSSSFFADAFDFAFLKDSQQLGLQVQRDFADLIEE